MVENVTCKSRAVNIIDRQGSTECNYGVEIGVYSHTGVSTDIRDCNGFFWWEHRLDVEFDKRFPNRHYAKGFQFSQTKDVYLSVVDFSFDRSAYSNATRVWNFKRLIGSHNYRAKYLTTNW